MVGSYQTSAWTGGKDPVPGAGGIPTRDYAGPSSSPSLNAPTAPGAQGTLNGRVQYPSGGVIDTASSMSARMMSPILTQNPTGNPLAGVASLVTGQYGPQQLLYADQLARQQAAMARLPADIAYQQNSMRVDNRLNQQLLGLQQQGLGLESGLAKGQLANLSKLRDILAKQRGLTREQLDNQLGQLKVDETKLRDNAARSQWDLRSDLTARGAFNTVANERGTGRIDRDLGYGLAGINHQRTAADIQFRNSLLGLDEKSIGYDNQQLALNTKLASIGLDGQALGIKQQQLNNALADGLYNIGMQGQITIDQLADAITGTNVQQAQLGLQMIAQIIGYSNLPPDLIAMLTAALTSPKALPPSQQGQSGGGASYKEKAYN